jgi:hypothetical protein
MQLTKQHQVNKKQVDPFDECERPDSFCPMFSYFGWYFDNPVPVIGHGFT